MIEIVSYECEFCGATFDDEEECENHELLEHDIKRYINEIHCWDCHGKSVDVINTIKNNDVLDITYIKCDSIEAMHAAIQLYDILGEYSPYEDDIPEGKELDLWYNSSVDPVEGIEPNCWIDLTYMRNEITSLMETIGIEERKI